MNYSVRIKQSAVKELSKLSDSDRLRIVASIDQLAETPHLGFALKGGLQGLRRIRVGPYRIVYEVQQKELVVLVIHIAHRREAYHWKLH